jgi:PhzF family phenazine biosynthesis protein
MPPRAKTRSSRASSAKSMGKPPGKSSAKARRTPAAKSSSKAKSKRAGAAGSTRPASGARQTPTQFPMFTVDAFTRRLFHGNPAAVVIVDAKEWPSDSLMQSIAAENNLAETAFVLRKPGAASARVGLRWFTPCLEMDLCGHATLAAAHVLWNHLNVPGDRLSFDTASGRLPVTRSDPRTESADDPHERITLDFPSRPGVPEAVSNAVCAALGRQPVEVLRARDLMCVFENRRDVYELRPDLSRLGALGTLGVIVTAPGSGHDFVSRFFAPGAGVAEDPVTGSAHCTLVPYWSAVLRKKSLSAHQVSYRGGELFCVDAGARVLIAGHAVTFAQGLIRV